MTHEWNNQDLKLKCPLTPSIWVLRCQIWLPCRSPTPVLLLGKSHGWRSLVGCSPWGREESDTTEQLHFHLSLSCIGEGNGNPLQCSCLENPRDGGAWRAAVYGVAQSWTRLKRFSSSSSSWREERGGAFLCDRMLSWYHCCFSIWPIGCSLLALILGPMSPSSESPWHPHSTCTYSKPSEEGLSSFFHLWVCWEILQEQMRYMRITWAAHSTPPFCVWAWIERAWIVDIKGNFL